MSNTQAATATEFTHRPVKVRVRFPKALRTVIGFIEDDADDGDQFETEVKRMIQLSGMVSPQYDAVALESWD
jgi:hypothetical protein